MPTSSIPPRRARLMIPGPTEMRPEIIDALAGQAVAHYGDDWLREHDETIELLARAFVTATQPILMVGAGTLFYFMVRAMARIQMPERREPGR